jgi:outer membrane receptor protein involved in Fe transport
MRAGAEAAIGSASLDLALPNAPRDGQPMGGFNPMDTTNKFNGSVGVQDFAAWSAMTFGISPDIRLTTGLRMDAFARGGDVAVQPRGELQWKLAEKTTMRLSAGAYRRPPENQDEFLHPELNPERSTQTILGYEYEPQEGTRLQTSLYYTDRTNLITRNPDGVLRNTGRGTTYGAEILGTLRRGPWFVWLTGTLSHSVRVDEPGATERLFQYDQPINVNAAVSWKRGKWQIGGRFQLYSGLPTTPVVGSVFSSDTNFYIPIFGPTYSERAPIHHQLDLRLDRSWHSGPVLMTFFIDVQNVYLNQSVAGYSYSYDYSQRIEFKSLPIIPSIGLRGVL